MALNKTQLKSSIQSLLTALAGNAELSPQSQQGISDFANGFADAIDTYVKTGTVSVNVTGTAPAPIPVFVDPITHVGATSFAGSVTGTGTGTIS